MISAGGRAKYRRAWGGDSRELKRHARTPTPAAFPGPIMNRPRRGDAPAGPPARTRVPRGSTSGCGGRLVPPLVDFVLADLGTVCSSPNASRDGHEPGSLLSRRRRMRAAAASPPFGPAPARGAYSERAVGANLRGGGGAAGWLTERFSKPPGVLVFELRVPVDVAAIVVDAGTSAGGSAAVVTCSISRCAQSRRREDFSIVATAEGLDRAGEVRKRVCDGARPYARKSGELYRSSITERLRNSRPSPTRSLYRPPDYRNLRKIICWYDRLLPPALLLEQLRENRSLVCFPSFTAGCLVEEQTNKKVKAPEPSTDCGVFGAYAVHLRVSDASHECPAWLLTEVADDSDLRVKK
ncbi:MAG: hypothetical protein BJ554DRAFT_6426 [Olpidium bornovanus]|uniref:Uncharacterized protein n=1 Tax=Olpidium bornovanus TaxID=278681 RepID=A0A8H7ZY21_9FUNG|nr:MAG: hypothetical protein BJ554DRAFT_6426 [Olpidium bornovanus]